MTSIAAATSTRSWPIVDSKWPDNPVPGAESYSEKYRAECEARSVSQMPNDRWRDRYFTLVERHRGRVATDGLRLNVAKLLGGG